MNNENVVDCPKCGGNGGEPGENFGDYGWHPCYFCGASGFITEQQNRAYEASLAAAPAYVPSRRFEE